MSRCIKCGKCDGGYYLGQDEASWVECMQLGSDRVARAVRHINTRLGLGGAITHCGDEFKVWVYDEEDAERGKSYLSAKECAAMSEAFRVLADALVKP